MSELQRLRDRVEIADDTERENSVQSLETELFQCRTLQEKHWVEELGPDITIKQQTKDRGRQCTQS